MRSADKGDGVRRLAECAVCVLAVAPSARMETAVGESGEDGVLFAIVSGDERAKQVVAADKQIDAWQLRFSLALELDGRASG